MIKVFNVVKGRGMLGFSPVDAPQSHPLVRVLLLEVTIYSFFTPVHFLFFDMLTFVMKRPVGHSLGAMLLL